MIVATAAWFVGAWPVLPFAGLDIALLCWAFAVVAEGDDDFEEFSVTGDQVSFTASRRKRRVAVRANRHWVRVEEEMRMGRRQLRLNYAGQSYAMGALLSDDQRADWVRELRALVRVESVDASGKAGATGRTDGI